MRIIQPETNRKAKVMIYGPTGGGKTTLLGTANDDVRTYPMLFLSYEGGTSSLVGRQIDIVEIRTWKDFDEAYDLLKSDSAENIYQSVGVDSVSETHVWALLTILEAATESRRRALPDLLEQGDYGIALTQMRKLLRKFRDLPIHVFVTALDRVDSDPREGQVKKPALTGALADEAPGIFEAVNYLSTTVDEANEVRRVLLMQNYPKFKVKTRLPIGVTIPNEMWDPTVTALLDLLQIEYPEEVQGKTQDKGAE